MSEPAFAGYLTAPVKCYEECLEANRDLIGGSLHARVSSRARNAHHLSETVAKAALGGDTGDGGVGHAPGLAAH